MSQRNEPTTLHYLFFGIPGYNSGIMTQYRSILKHSYSSQAKFRLAAINHLEEFGCLAVQKAFGGQILTQI